VQSPIIINDRMQVCVLNATVFSGPNKWDVENVEKVHNFAICVTRQQNYSRAQNVCSRHAANLWL